MKGEGLCINNPSFRRKTNPSQLAKEFRKMIEKIIMGLSLLRTRDGNFKTTILPKRKRVMFMLHKKAGKVIENLIGCFISPQFASVISDS